MNLIKIKGIKPQLKFDLFIQNNNVKCVSCDIFSLLCKKALVVLTVCRIETKILKCNVYTLDIVKIKHTSQRQVKK